MIGLALSHYRILEKLRVAGGVWSIGSRTPSWAGRWRCGSL